MTQSSEEARRERDTSMLAASRSAVEALGLALARLLVGEVDSLHRQERKAIELACATLVSADRSAPAAALREWAEGLPLAATGVTGADLWQACIEGSKTRASAAVPALSHGQRSTTAERAAALEKSPGKRGTHRAAVLMAIVRATKHGEPVSKNAVAERMGFGWTRDRVHPRMNELMQGGWIEKIPDLTLEDGDAWRATPKATALYNSGGIS